MPIFEYRCADCSNTFEKIVFRTEGSIECPACGSERTKKLISSFAVKSEKVTGFQEQGPCPCGAAQRGMCQAMAES